MRNLLIILFIALISTSCVTVEFTEPQPAGISSLNTFPVSFQGTYLIAESSNSDFSEMDTLVIFPEGFLAISLETEEWTLEEAETNPDIRIKDSLLYRMDKDPNIGYPFVRTDSTIGYSYWEKETSFLSDSIVLKDYKGEYYLSIRDEPNRYNVLLLKKDRNDDVSAWMIDPENEMEEFRKFTSRIEDVYNSEGEIDKYIASPKAKELRKFVENGGFRQSAYRLYRVR